MIILQNQWKTNSCCQTQYWRERPYVHTSWAELYTCSMVKKSPLWAAQKWLFHSAYFCNCRMMESIFVMYGSYGKNAEFSWSQYFDNFFSTKSKLEDAIYMGIIYMSFLSRNCFVKIFTPCRCLCGVMNFSVYWNDDYTSIVFFYLVFKHMKSVTQKI